LEHRPKYQEVVVAGELGLGKRSRAKPWEVDETVNHAGMSGNGAGELEPAADEVDGVKPEGGACLALGGTTTGCGRLRFLPCLGRVPLELASKTMGRKLLLSLIRQEGTGRRSEGEGAALQERSRGDTSGEGLVMADISLETVKDIVRKYLP
jgi:hypothetical protein